MKPNNFAGHDIHLKTERLLLQPLQRGDFRIALPFYNDPEFKAGMEGNPEMFIDLNQLERIGEFMAKRGYLFAVVEKNSERVIGEVCLEWMNLTRANVQPGEKVMRSPIGIWDKTCWRKGYGKEILQKIMEYAFNTIGADRLCGMDIAAENIRSRKLFESCGYRYVRTVAEDGCVDYEITREEYFSRFGE